MNPLHLRRYRPADRAGCLRLFEGNIPGSFLPYEIPVFLEFLDYFSGPYLVVELGGALVACGGLAEHAEHLTLCWGLVGRESQRQGIGRFLLQTRLALALCVPGARQVHLNTSQHTAPFFASAGFQTRHVTLNAYASGLHRHDMVLRLGPATRQKIAKQLAGLQAADSRFKISDLRF